MWKKTYNYILAVCMGILVNCIMYKVILSFYHDKEILFDFDWKIFILIFLAVNVLFAIGIDYVVQNAKKKGVNPVGYILSYCLPSFIYAVSGVDMNEYTHIQHEIEYEYALASIDKSQILSIQTILVMVLMITILFFKKNGLDKWIYLSTGFVCNFLCSILILGLTILLIVSGSHSFLAILIIFILILLLLMLVMLIIHVENVIISKIREDNKDILYIDEKREKRDIWYYNFLVVLYPSVIWLILSYFWEICFSKFSEWPLEIVIMQAWSFNTLIVFIISVIVGNRIYKKD